MKKLPKGDKDVLNLVDIKALCHRFYAPLCVEEKRDRCRYPVLVDPRHWSVAKKEEQFKKIDLGERIPFDIALPLPAKDRGFAETDVGVELFEELFKCERCGRCCFTKGAGLVLEERDFKHISDFIGSKKKLKKLCSYDEKLNLWILKQPCPFYERSHGCKIYPVRPLTCTKYPLHPPIKDMPFHLAVDAFCPAARKLAKETLGLWAVCERNWALILKEFGYK